MVGQANDEVAPGLALALADILGAEHVLADLDTRAHLSQDLFFIGAVAALAVRPGTREELARAVACVTDAGFAIVPRGGGLSYTGGYVPRSEASVLFDTRRLDRIIEINADDMYVTVEAGCTWAALYDALTPFRLRPPHFGPASGRISTIGGSLSQHSAFFGSGLHGTSADSTLSLEVVLANGEVLRTGSAAVDGMPPFLRTFGPDLTGLFLGDCGAFGVKAAATLRLSPAPGAAAFASFAFTSFEDMIEAQTGIGRQELASECLGVGPYAPSGADPTGPTLHLVVEGRDGTDAEARLEVLRAIALSKGREADAALPRFIRADPFGFVDSVLDPEGRLQAWTHGAVPYSAAAATHGAVRDYLNSQANIMARHGITATLTVALSLGALLIEPVLYWRDALRPAHLRAMSRGALGEGVSSGEAPNPEDPEATKAVADLRGGLRGLFLRLHAAHLQVGKFYAYREALSPTAWSALEGLKRQLDPKGLMNPGALGLE